MEEREPLGGLAGGGRAPDRGKSPRSWTAARLPPVSQCSAGGE